MKKTLFLFLFSVLYNLSFGQNTKYFNKLLFPNISTNSLQSVIKADSNYFVLYGWLDTPYIDKQGLGLLKLDLSGNIVKSKLIKDSTINYFNYPGNSLIYTSDSCLIIAAVLEDTLFKDHSILIKTNKNLDIIWTKEFSHPDTLAASQIGANVFNTLTAVRQTYDGGFIIAGNYNPNCNTTYHNMYLLKTDSLGDFQWIKKFPNKAESYDIEITPDSGYVFLSIPSYGIDLIKTDKLGNYQWTLHYNSNFRHRIGQNIKILDDFNLLVCSQYIYLDDNVYGYPNALDIAKINFSTQQIVWEKRYFSFGNLRCLTLHQSIDLELTKNNDLIISSNTTVLNPMDVNELSFKGFLMKVNSNGDSLWSRYYGIGDFEDECQFNDLVLTDDGGFLAVGYHYAYHPGIMYQDAWIVKMDSFGCDTPGCQSVGLNELKVESGRLKVYPNPASDFIHLEMDYSRFEDEEIVYKIVDVLGKIQTEGVLAERIDIQQLKPGVYSVILYSNSKAIANKKLTVIK